MDSQTRPFRKNSSAGASGRAALSGNVLPTVLELEEKQKQVKERSGEMSVRKYMQKMRRKGRPLNFLLAK